MLIGIAIEEGKITSVDDLAGEYIPEFNKNGREKITIRHLLTMSAGFDWVESGKNPLSEAAEGYYGTDLYGLVTRLRVIDKPGLNFKIPFIHIFHINVLIRPRFYYHFVTNYVREIKGLFCGLQ